MQRRKGIRLTVESTADADEVKITLSEPVAGTGRSFDSKESAADHPLAAAVLSVHGVQRVYLLGNFVRVRKRPEADWRAIGPAVQAAIHAVVG